MKKGTKIFALELRLVHPDGRVEELRMVPLAIELPVQSHYALQYGISGTLHTTQGDVGFGRGEFVQIVSPDYERLP